MRLRYKVLLINSVAALVAAVVLSVAYANTRSVAQEYLMTLEEVVPKSRALDGLQSAIIAVIGSTHERALLRLAPQGSRTRVYYPIARPALKKLASTKPRFFRPSPSRQNRSPPEIRSEWV